MNYLFSPSTIAFYPIALKSAYINAGTLPDDVVEVDDSVFNEFSAAPPDGYQRGVENGAPMWVEISVPEETEAQRKAHARMLRDAFITATDKMTVADYTINDTALTGEQKTELLNVRLAFKEWPASENWPEVELPEIPMWILIEAVNNGYVVPNWPK